MKKILSLLTVISLFFVIASQVSAKVIKNDKGEASVLKDEVVDDDLFIGAQTVQIDGVVNGDVFIGAQTVTITGTINGNVHVGANTIDLKGTVTGNVYGGAQNISVSESTIGGSLIVGGATVRIEKDVTIGGSVLAGANVFSLDSQVKRSVYVGSRTMTIGSDAIIGKDMYYASGKGQGIYQISPDATIAGSIHKSEINIPQNDAKIRKAQKQIPAAMNTGKTVFAFIFFVGALIIGFLYQKLFGKHFSQTTDLVKNDFWKALGIGFLAVITLIPGLIMLCITIVGIPLAGMVFLMFLLYSYLGKMVVGAVIGNWVSGKLNWKMPAFAAFALGLVIITCVNSIPVIGFFTGLVVYWVGLGALTLKTFSKEN